jgi:hypothetical protein
MTVLVESKLGSAVGGGEVRRKYWPVEVPQWSDT